MYRHRIRVTGIVQGVGFRPFVWRVAQAQHLSGWVCNDSHGVLIEAQGDAILLERFEKELQQGAPPLAVIESVEILGIPLQHAQGESPSFTPFRILDSDAGLPVSTSISPDIGTCDECIAELMDPSDRRFRYPFINCTHCGPRFTIITGLPYDRPSTTMDRFSLCKRCANEYSDPNDRRYHAQPIACPDCGPKLWWVPTAEFSDGVLQSPAGGVLRSPGSLQSDQAMAAAVQALQQGCIVAIKGIGGFHLACDARNAGSVALLRERKRRGDKPLAVMVRDLDMARELVRGHPSDWRLLQSKERPIVLVSKREDAGLPDWLAPGNDSLGVLLPYSPLHHILMADFGGPLVMTSGNLSEEPIATENAEARDRLHRIADGFLLHDRPIHAVCDDSVVRSLGSGLMPIRRSRGYAPMPVRFLSTGPDVLAVGAELKGTFCLVKGKHAYVSQHLGDMSNLETLRAFERNVDLMQSLLELVPATVVCDLHPDYLVSQWARRLASEKGIPLLEVQHHHAHLASLAAEHRLDPDQPLCGFVLDGTGYGSDGTIWGGEVLIGRGAQCERIAWVEPFALPGGDAAIRHPARVALSLLRAAGIQWTDDLASVRACDPTQLNLLWKQLERQLNCINTSSMGRVFDAVASLIGVRHTASYEAQAAMELEAFAARGLPLALKGEAESSDGTESAEGSIQLSATGLTAELVAAHRAGVSKEQLAARFHLAVVHWITRVAVYARDAHDIDTFGLTGGVFQNALLTKLATQSLERLDLRVLTHRIVPCNDGGLALGQAWIARCRAKA